MTPAVEAARAAGIGLTLHEFDPGPTEGFGAQAVAALGLPAERVLKTLVARLDARTLAVAVVPVARCKEP